MTELEEYYNKFNEEKRLNSRHGRVEFITSMKEFRSHKRPSSIMSHIAEGYSDEEFERMARYFNGIRIKGDVK